MIKTNSFRIVMHNRLLLSFYMKTYAYLWLSRSPYITFRSIPLLLCELSRGPDNSVVDSRFSRRFIHKHALSSRVLLRARKLCIYARECHACISRLTKKVSTCTRSRETHVNKVNAGCGWKNFTCAFQQGSGRLKCIRLCLSNIKTVRRKIVYCVSFKIMGNARGHIVLPLFCQNTF